MRRVVVTGLGAVTPLGNDARSTWEAAIAGRSGIDWIRSFDASGFPVRVAAEVKDFDGATVVPPKEARRLERNVLLAVAAAREAVADAQLNGSDPAGFDSAGFDPARVGIVLGSAIGGVMGILEQADVMRERGADRVSPFFLPNVLVDSASGQVAITLGIRGPNYAVVSACATGSHAVGEGAELIKRGDADVTRGWNRGLHASAHPRGLLRHARSRGRRRRATDTHRGRSSTSAMTGLGTRWLAAPEADEMALIGTGAQAITQVAAVNAVRPLRRLRVFSPTPEKRKAFVDNVASRFDFDVVDSPTLEAATRDASIVTLVTRAKDPFLRASMLARGAHLNAVGAILPASAEFDQDVFDRTGMIAVDDVPNARRASRELIERFGSDDAAWGAVKPLGELIARGTGRPSGTDVTIFKSMGMGISDLSVAMLVLERAREQRAGQSIPHPKRAVPRWNTTAVKV